MPKQLPAPKHAPAIPLSGSVGGAFPVGSLSTTKAQPRAVAQTRTQAEEDAITRYFFIAHMVLTVLGLAAVGYALLTM